MAEKKRGITIELGGDASGLEKALGGVNSKIVDTQNQLKDVQKLLKLDPKNTELLRQKQKLLGDQIANTSQKLETLKQAQNTMDANGVDKNSAQYMALQREIVSTENEMKSLQKASRETSAAMSSIAQAADKVSKGAKKVANATKGISTAAAGALTALGGLALKSAQSADELSTLAKQTGFSAEELQKFEYASELVDVSLNDITGAATKLKKAVAGGSKELEQLGVKTKNAKGEYRNINDVFYDTLAALGKVKNETERDALAMSIFGKSADSLAGIIDDGGAALKSYGKEAESLGLIMSSETVEGLNSVNDRISQIKAQAKALFAQSGAKALEALLPVLKQLFEFLDRVFNVIGQLTPAQIEMAAKILAVVAAISPLASILGTISGLISKLPLLISGVTTAVSALLANPYALIGAAIIAAIIAIIVYGDKLKAWISAFGKWLSAGISAIASGIRNAFTSVINGIISMINRAIAKINSLIKGINSIGKSIGINIGSIGTIPMMANGGVLSKGTAIVGEAGPELLSVNNGRAVVQPMTNAGAGSTKPIYITVQSVLDGRIIAASTTKYQERTAVSRG